MEGAAASSARWGDREGKDVERAWRWLRTQSGVDREDGVLVGASLGGAAVLRAAAAAGESGVSQAILLAPASDLHAIVDWRMHWLGSIAPVFGNLVEWHLSGLGVRLLSSSPSPAQTFARNALPPQLLVFHGDSDKKIPTSLSQDVAAGIPGSRLGVLRGVGHDDIPGFVARDSAAWAEVQRVLEGYRKSDLHGRDADAILIRGSRSCVPYPSFTKHGDFSIPNSVRRSQDTTISSRAPKTVGDINGDGHEDLLIRAVETLMAPVPAGRGWRCGYDFV